MIRITARLSALVALALVVPLRAAEPLDIPALLGSPAETVEATVFLVAPTVVYSNALGEADVRRVGCRYATVDPASIRALLDVLAMSDVQTSPIFQQPDVRAVVLLAHADGARLGFTLQDNLGSRLRVIGVLETSVASTLRSVPLTARSVLMSDLREWAVRFGGTGDGAGCRPTR